MEAEDRNARANNIRFHEFCTVLERIRVSRKVDDKLKALEEFLKQHGLLYDVNVSMYPMIRLLLPHLDRSRTYNIKHHTLSRAFCGMIGVTDSTTAGQMLRNWNDPEIMKSHPQAVGDLPAVVEIVMQNRVSVKESILTIRQVHELLDELVRADKKKQYEAALRKWTSCLSPRDMKWMVRIIVKDMKIYLGHDKIFDCIHNDAKDMYAHTNDLERVVTTCIDPEIRYVTGIQPFQTFSPMLAKRVEFAECIRVLDCEEFGMEPKLDGERIICHWKDKKCELISRNGKNYTSLYGPSIIPMISKQIMNDVDCVLDGEMLVWDSMSHRFDDFGSLKTVAQEAKDKVSESRWLCYVVWDLIYLGGLSSPALLGSAMSESLPSVMGLPLKRRRQLLEKIVKPISRRFELNPQIVVNSSSLTDPHHAYEQYHRIAMAYVDKLLLEGYEGVILKDLGSHYSCGEQSRKRKRWIKLKPDYAGMTQDMDVLILGGYHGRGRLRTGISRFLVGVAAAPIEPGKTRNPPFLTLARVGTGYKLSELAILCEQLKPHWKKWDPNAIPKHLGAWAPTGDDVPDFWIPPEHSRVLEVIGFEVLYSQSHTSGLTIRFPRCKRIRYDKEWFECLSAQDLNQLKGKTSCKRKAVDISASQARTSQKKPVTRSIMNTLAQSEIKSVAKVSQVFENLEFCVLPARGFDKQETEKLIVKHGGCLVQNPLSASTNYCVAPCRDSLKVRNIIKHGNFNVITPDWIKECDESNTLQPFRARHYIFANSSTQSELASQFDRYGDHFTELCSMKELTALLQQMKPMALSKAWQLKAQELIDVEQQVFESDATFFYHCCVYVEGKNAELELIRQVIKYFGGRICSTVSKETTHIVASKTSSELIFTLEQHRATYSSEPSLVNINWVYACVAAKHQLEPFEYQLK